MNQRISGVYNVMQTSSHPQWSPTARDDLNRLLHAENGDRRVGLSPVLLPLATSKEQTVKDFALRKDDPYPFKEPCTLFRQSGQNPEKSRRCATPGHPVPSAICCVISSRSTCEEPTIAPHPVQGTVG